MVGSIGEVLAAYLYNLDLLDNSTEKHDAKTKTDKLVQIKATQGKRVSIRSQPDYLIVLKLSRDGSADEVYNGPGAPAWDNAGKMQKNGQRPITLSRLSKLMVSIQSKDKILQARNL